MKNYKEQSRQNFDRQADCYDTLSSGGHARKLYPILLAQLAGLPKGSILDLGCGTGELLYKITTRWPETACTGLDLSPNMVRTAREKLGNRANILQGDAEYVPFPDCSFQVVLCSGSFHHYPAPERVLEEVHRILTPGGIFLLADTTAPFPVRQIINLFLPFGHGGDVRIYSANEMAALISQTFCGVKSKNINMTSLIAWGIK